ncbi:hypothetical protein [Mycobacterium intracellulare]|uniref:hypothetical protein n=1 Tax=Mycobacterium intracellulare TaxID=1767 RepID=UPI0006CA7694|nr:hypothetical protein [Mycobacterium intracellulare]KPN47698.1 hypothetical protein AN933_24085 [Mycobacterium intracellulare subsp. chimaera]
MLADKVVKVVAPSLAQAGTAVAQTAAHAATPRPGAAPVAAPGSAVDGALAGFTVGLAAQSATMASQAGHRGPAIQTTTQSGITDLLGADEQNAEDIRALGLQAAPSGAVPPAGGVWV